MLDVEKFTNKRIFDLTQNMQFHVALLVTKLIIHKLNSNEKFGFSSWNGTLQFQNVNLINY
jgi:hypothetical protein